ncbi:D-alanine--D-alanine ligase [Shouchella shacheensis]|uniref:D-alanine--D-alanine ligase n=1 Tax=Shouchella shacheensis TaxID=1649580 RepID=UPI00073FC360|nr:D-alanine--D-alanine ligase [Shouchella shacheensis]
MSKKRVGVIFGGKSAEHEVSLQSAKNIVDAIDKKKFDVTLIGIDKEGQWHINEASNFLLNAENPALIELNKSGRGVALIPGKEEHQLVEASGTGVLDTLDVIFPIVHGTLGEDGSLQGMLRLANIPYVGSNVLSSAISMDKDIAKRLLKDANLNVAAGVAFTRAKKSTIDFEEVTEQLGLPLFIKPANQGSSVGVSKVSNEAEFWGAVDNAFSFDHKILIEAAVVGREIECAVLGNDDPKASVCGEILPQDGFYSYDAKYIDEDGAKLAIPADVPEAVHAKIQAVAVRAYEALNCEGLARVDVFLTKQEEVIVNEINTLPGFTKISMYPKLWEESGLSYEDLITELLELAMKRHEQDRELKSSVFQRD